MKYSNLSLEKELVKKSTEQSEFSEASLWQAFQEGDESAYALIYQKYFGNLYRYGLKICSEREIIKDLIHDLFLDLWKKKENLGGTDSIKFYLFKALKGRILNYFKLSNKLYSSSESYFSEAYDDSLEQTLIDDQVTKEQKLKIFTALEKLTKREKVAIDLKFFQGLKNEEVAHEMSITKDSLYNIISKALHHIKKNLDKIYGLIILLHI